MRERNNCCSHILLGYSWLGVFGILSMWYFVFGVWVLGDIHTVVSTKGPGKSDGVLED